MNNAQKILAKGLQATYAGSHNVSSVTRGKFTLQGTEAAFPDSGDAYSDQWFVHRTGAGQELAGSGDAYVSRVYAGGIFSDETLGKLGISEQEVIAYLKQKLSTLAEKTRLLAAVSTPPDGEWQYSYVIDSTYPEISLTVGIETIRYKGTAVFVHVILNTPVA